MSVVLNEYAWAEEALRNRELGRKPYETLSRVAKYYAHNGMGKNELRTKLDDFLLACEPGASLVVWGDTLDKAAKYAFKYPLVLIESLTVTDAEIKIIEALPGMQLQRLAFTLLCLSKYMYTVNPQTDNWVSTPDREIMNMANISTSIKRQSQMFGQLRDAGLIRFSKKIDNLSVQVLFNTDGEPAAEIKDFRNLGYQYMMMHSSGYYICEECGITCKAPSNQTNRGRKRKYCSSCAAKVAVRQRVNAVMSNKMSAQKLIS